MNRKTFATIVISVLVLSACDSAEDEFVAECMLSGSSRETCECYFEFGSDGLSEQHMTLFAAMASADEGKVAKAQSDLGVVGTAAALAKISWVIANAEKACGK